MDLQEALDQIAAGEVPARLESDRLGFKQEARSDRETMEGLARASICFANAEGGAIVVGVADDLPGAEALLGTQLDPIVVKERIYRLSRPPLLVDSVERWYRRVRLVVITVPAGVDVHSDTQGRVHHRVGRACFPMTAQAQQIRQAERRGLDWSGEPAGISGADVDADALAAARDRLGRVDDERRPLVDLPDMELLRSLGVVDGDGRLLRAGQALFRPRGDDNPWVVYQHRLTPGGEATAVERICGPLVTVLDRLIGLVWARRHITPLTLPDGSQIELADFPLEAVREAVVNALLHREFRIDRPVSVEHSPDAFIVESPGRLVSGITEHNILTHPSKPRNPCLFRAARHLRMAEDTGRGIDRIYRELLRSGRDVPAITQTVDTTRVAFVGGAPRTQVARFVAQLGPNERDDVDTLLVIFTLLTSRTLSEDELAPIIQKQPAEARSVLARLASEKPGILETTLESSRRRKPNYRLRAAVVNALGGAVSYHRPGIEAVDLKVILHIRDYGRINNRTLRNIFDIDVYRASLLLRDLQDRGLLVRISRHQRGPGVEYGPGPQFPAC